MPVTRVSIADAFKSAELPLPADFLKSNTSNRDGTPCIRSVQQPAFCVTASHPHTWCDRAGVTVRCLKPSESAVLMGFPRSWRLPLGSRVGTRAVGNAVRRVPCRTCHPAPPRTPRRIAQVPPPLAAAVSDFIFYFLV